jgi:hypothetical protein
VPPQQPKPAASRQHRQQEHRGDPDAQLDQGQWAEFRCGHAHEQERAAPHGCKQEEVEDVA